MQRLGVEAGDSVVAAGKKRSSPARCCFPGSGEEAKRELVLWRSHSRTEEAPAASVAAARWCSSCSHGGVSSVNRRFRNRRKGRKFGEERKERKRGGGGGREERRNPRAGVGAPGAALCRGGAAGGSTWGELGCNPLPAPLFRTKLGARPDRRWVGMDLGQAQQAWPGLGLFFFVKKRKRERERKRVPLQMIFG